MDLVVPEFYLRLIFPVIALVVLSISLLPFVAGTQNSSKNIFNEMLAHTLLIMQLLQMAFYHLHFLTLAVVSSSRILKMENQLSYGDKGSIITLVYKNKLVLGTENIKCVILLFRKLAHILEN